MVQANRDKSIDIVKGIGIILMVVGHSGCPKWLHDFIYAFHMPLFFICSGYFYKPISTIEGLFTFWKKRFKGLYFPYIKWSILFLLLHNVFYRLNIYSDSYGYLGSASTLYTFNDILIRLKDILLCMESHEELLGGFWFLRVLLFSSIGFSIIDYMLCEWKIHSIKYLIVFCLLLLFTFIAWYVSMQFWVLDSLFLFFYGCLFFLLGYLYRTYYSKLEVLENRWVNILCIILVIIGAIFVKNAMPAVNVPQIIPYLIVASAGSLIVFNIARLIEKKKAASILIYIGRHTMVILALHFLSFKLINLIKIYGYNLPIKMLSCFPVIEDYNKYYWIAYVLVGICIPLIISSVYEKNKNAVVGK